MHRYEKISVEEQAVRAAGHACRRRLAGKVAGVTVDLLPVSHITVLSVPGESRGSSTRQRQSRKPGPRREIIPAHRIIEKKPHFRPLPQSAHPRLTICSCWKKNTAEKKKQAEEGTVKPGKCGTHGTCNG